MADNRKYYYLKLKENFFDSDSIVLLEDMKDGILYSNILLKLYLKSLKNPLYRPDDSHADPSPNRDGGTGISHLPAVRACGAA